MGNYGLIGTIDDAPNCIFGSGCMIWADSEDLHDGRVRGHSLHVRSIGPLYEKAAIRQVRQISLVRTTQIGLLIKQIDHGISTGRT